MSPPLAVEVEALTKLYGPRPALNGLSFALPLGSLCGLAGPNGAGKTTALRVLLGMVRPTGGAAKVLGHSIAHPERYLARVGALIEGPGFHPALTGRRNLQVLARLGGVAGSVVDSVLDQVGLAGRAGDRYGSYSLGMKQRLGIAAALLRRPELLVLDEPMNGLDPAGMREIRALLRELVVSGVTVLVSSHLLTELEQICDHLVVIRAGQLVFEGSVDELLGAARQPALVARAEVVFDTPRLVELCAAAGYPASVADGCVHICAPAAWAGELNRRAMRDGITLVRLGTTQRGLEDAFLDLTETGR
jgi:ABC-2 type transport system ATP-binding protein